MNIKAENTADVVIEKILFTGDASLLTQSQHTILSAEIIGKKLSQFDLRSFITQVKRQLREMGYMTSLVNIPPQDITSGNLTVNITIGRLDTPPYELHTQAATDTLTYAERVLSSKLHAGQPLLKDDLEEAMLLVNKVAGLTASSKMQAGSRPGTTVLAVDVATYEDDQFSWDLANTGNNTTGIEVWTGQWQWQNPFSNHNQYELGLTKSAGMTSLSAKRQFAPSSSAGHWYAGINHVTYSSITSDPTTSGLHGRSLGGEVGYKRSLSELMRSNSSLDISLHASSVYDANLLSGTNMVMSDKQLHHLDVKYQLRDSDLVLPSSLFNFETTLSIGDVALPTDSNIIQNYTVDQTPGGGAFTDGGYATLNLLADYTHSLTSEWQWNANLSGQFASKNLDGSAKYSLGGPNGVRAYPSGEASADEGAKVKLELRWQPKSLATFHAPKFTLFYDAGYAKLYNDPHIGGGISINTDLRKNEYSLEGNGLTIVGTPSASHQWSITYAHKSGYNPGRDFLQNDSDGANSANRYWFKWQSRF